MERILKAFIKRNATIGYCQGMNFLVGRLRKFLTEEVSLKSRVNIFLGNLLGFYHDCGDLPPL